jgi:hypothetical protein
MVINIQFPQMVEAGIHPQACRFLKLHHHHHHPIHSSYGKSIIMERKNNAADKR